MFPSRGEEQKLGECAFDSRIRVPQVTRILTALYYAAELLSGPCRTWLLQIQGPYRCRNAAWREDMDGGDCR
jgi:hypothetical protein